MSGLDVMIWGTGWFAENCRRYLRDDVRLLCFVESTPQRESFLGVPVVCWAEALQMDYDYAILANTHEEEIAKAFSLPDEKVIRYRSEAERFPEVLRPWDFPLTDANPWLMEQYDQENWREEVINPQRKLCYVFFSSNGIYFPNERETFHRTIVERDRYEWENIAQSKEIRETAGKILFVRDIFKQWYVTGINARVNSMEKLLSFLRERTEGYETITCGNSSGGYMSVLGGVTLHSKQVFDISGQWSLYHHFDHVEKDYFLRKYAGDPERSRFYDVRGLVLEAEALPQINYLWPAGSAQDVRQYKLVKHLPMLNWVKAGDFL